MKRAVLLALMLGGCQTNAQSSRQQAEQQCRQWVSQGIEKNYAECVETTVRNYAILDNVAAAQVADRPSYGPAYYPQPGTIPPSDAPAIQNIIPPTVRCQSVPAGLGTVQTVCR